MAAEPRRKHECKKKRESILAIYLYTGDKKHPTTDREEEEEEKQERDQTEWEKEERERRQVFQKFQQASIERNRQ